MGVPSRFGQIQADAFLGSAHDNSPFGKVWYVDVVNGADGNAGDAPDEAYSTIGAAILAAKATRGDTVVIAPGTYTVTSALVAKAMMTFRAAVVNPQFPTISIRGNIAEMVTADVSGTRWVGIEFRSTGATTAHIVDVADGASVEGATFEDCVFRGANLHEVGLRAFDATFNVSGLVVRRCLFRDLGGTPLGIGILGMRYAKIEDNTFVIDTPSGTGIRMGDTTGATQAAAVGKGFVIRNNDFIGLESLVSVGITLEGTEDKLALSLIRTNYFGNCIVGAITPNKAPKSMVRNYVGDSGTGGTIVDAGD